MTTIGNNSLLMAEIGRIAEVWLSLDKRMGQRNGGNISVNLTGLLTPEEMELPALCSCYSVAGSDDRPLEDMYFM